MHLGAKTMHAKYQLGREFQGKISDGKDSGILVDHIPYLSIAWDANLQLTKLAEYLHALKRAYIQKINQ